MSTSPARPAPESPFETLLRELQVALASAEPREIPGVLGALERARGRALERLMRVPTSAPEDVMLTMEDVARRLAINVSQARELGRRGELPTVTVGERFVRVRQSSLEDWIRRREAGRRVSL
jgi:excisionase family DNA binding protein